MSDTEGTSPASETPREGATGRYVSGRNGGKSGDEPAPAQGGGGGAKPPAGDDAQAGKDDEKEGRKRWLLLLLLLLILLLLLCAGFVYMKWFKKPAETTTNASPSVVATTTSAAPKPSPTPVVSPTPVPTKTATMPDVVGKPAPEAKTILEAAGFTNIKFVDETKPNDALSLLVSYVVTKQSVAPGTQVPVDTALVITAKTSSSGKG